MSLKYQAVAPKSVSNSKARCFTRAYTTQCERHGHRWLGEVGKKQERRYCSTWKSSNKDLAGLVSPLTYELFLEVALPLVVCGSTSCVLATWRFCCAAHRASKVAYSFSKDSLCNPRLFSNYSSFHLLGKANSRLLANLALYYYAVWVTILWGTTHLSQ